MLSITTKSPYALSALVELHRLQAAGPVPIAELARRRAIPVQFLEQLFASLRRAGILRSQRGVKGGYTLARPAAEVTVLELVEVLDGPLGAGASGVFGQAVDAAAAVLSEATVASVSEQEIRAAGAPMYYI
jgi:Rrf2 family cysteine metabolism transcriptional repressor